MKRQIRMVNKRISKKGKQYEFSNRFTIEEYDATLREQRQG